MANSLQEANISLSSLRDFFFCLFSPWYLKLTTIFLTPTRPCQYFDMAVLVGWALQFKIAFFLDRVIPYKWLHFTLDVCMMYIPCMYTIFRRLPVSILQQLLFTHWWDAASRLFRPALERKKEVKKEVLQICVFLALECALHLEYTQMFTVKKEEKNLVLIPSTFFRQIKIKNTACFLRGCWFSPPFSWASASATSLVRKWEHCRCANFNELS